MPFKRCVVNSCSNNNKNCPNKIFLCLPTEEKRRLRWYKALNTTKIPHNSKCRVCEDHFDLPEDSLNWMYFKMMGKKIILKDDVVPHKNMFPVDEVSDKAEPEAEPIPSQLSDSTRKRKAEYLDSTEVSSVKKTKRVLFENVEQTTPSMKTETSSATASTSYESLPSGSFTVKLHHVGIQVRPEVKSQFTSTEDP